MSNTTDTAAQLVPEPPPETRFVLIGAGGLGCPVALNLLAAGAERMLLLDDDVVDTSNLQRQVLYTVGDVGALKADAARHQLRRRAPFADIQTRAQRLEASGVEEFIAGLGPMDVVLECTDAPEIKFALNDACVAAGRKLVIGGVVGWRGQTLAVAPQPDAPAACYRCIYEAPPQQAATCAGVGVIGAAAGHVGALMAQLAWALAAGRPVAGQLHAIDFRILTTQTLSPSPRSNCEACGKPNRAASA